MPTVIHAKKSLGQNFLIDRNIARKIVSLIEITPEDYLVEIGSGLGILTQFFFEMPTTVVAVEIDERCVEILRDRFPESERFRILHQDVLKLPHEDLVQRDRVNKWVGNLPYNITSPVLFRMLDLVPAVKRAVFMVQAEVADRIVASPGTREYGILSVLLQSFYSVKKAFTVSRSVFRPSPKVDSAVISLDILPQIELHCHKTFFKDLVKTGFNQRRKRLKNALAGMIPAEAMKNLTIDLNRRAEQLSIKEWKELCRQLSEKSAI